MKYITINLVDHTVRTYDTYEQAYDNSCSITNTDPEHPAFHLYQSNGNGEVATFVGRLTRNFGQPELYFSEEYYKRQ